MDFKNSDITTGTVLSDLNGADAAVALEAAATLAVALQAGNILPLTADGQLVLPAGVGLDDIKVSGRNLIIQMPDGTQMIVPDGAVFVPQIVVDGVAVPPLNIAALLIGQEPVPAAGRPQSSGGNFADAVGDIGDPFGLGDLLPPTQLAFPEPEQREIIPNLVDKEPTTIIITPDQPAGSVNATASVQEAALPARGNEPSGSNPTSNAETTTGNIVFDAPDGLGSITLNGVAVTAVGQTFVTPLGTLTITSIAPGNIGYSYTLADNTTQPSSMDVFAVVVTDSDGDTASADLTISIVDDVPTARNDTDSITAGTYGPQTGNVMAGAGTTSGATGADTPGADGAVLSGARAGTGTGALTAIGAPIVGQYGTLVFNDATGNYTYSRNVGTAGGVNDVFTYQLTDGDGDTSTATLTIAIGDSPPAITFVPSVGEGTVVSEVGLPARGSETPGSNPELPVESTTGTITFLSPDGVASVSLGGTVITPGALPQQVFSDATGTLVVTAYSYNPETGVGSVTYSYTLTDNTVNTNGTVVSFPIVVIDLDGDRSPEDKLDITILDDAPRAENDTAGLTEGGPSSVTFDVDTNDVPGADGTASRVFTTLTGTYGTITVNADGTQTYMLSAAGQLAIDALAPGSTLTDSFNYTLTDGDTDTDPATLLVTLTGTDDPVVITNLTPAADGGDVTVDEDDLPTGSDASPESLTQSGDFTISAPDGLDDLTVGTVNVIVNGVYVGGSATTPLGNTLTFTGYNAATGVVSYTYTLTAAEAHADGADENSLFENFTVTLTDLDGSTTDGTLSVNIVDDIPEAKADEDNVTEDDFSGESEAVSADGNVITGMGGNDANLTDGVKDVQGADGAAVTAVSFGSTSGMVGGATAGLYGELTLNADGSYTYILDNFNPAVQGLDGNDTLTEVFTYTITDDDGDTSETQLTITINGSDDPITINGLNVEGPELTVDEDDLSDGSDPAPKDPLTQTGTFTVDGVDGIAAIKIEGGNVAVGQAFSTAYGTFTITSVSAPVDGTATSITIGYSYTLTDNTAHTNAGGQNFLTEVFDIDVTDTDGSTDSDTIEVRIVDDVPTAADDADTVPGGSSAAATGNVITDTAPTDDVDTDAGADVKGADGATVISVVSINLPANSDNTLNEAGEYVVNGEFGVLTIKPDGSYSYVRNDGSPGDRIDQFTYTIRDGDGDTDDAVLRITIEDDKPVVGENPAVLVDDDALGGNPASTTGDDVDPQNATGTLSGSGGDGALTWAFQTTGAPSGFQYLPSGTGILVQQNQGGSWVTVATVTLDTANGDYTVTQNNPVIHADGDNENNLSVTLNYTVNDVDLDSTPGSLTINFDDDAPTATAEPAQSVGEGGTINGAVDFVEGADGASVTHVNGTALIFGGDGFSQSLDIGNGSIKVKADGTYVFTADNPVIGTGSANATFTITDGDKDTVTATAAFTITDVNKPSGGSATAAVDDDGLSTGNAASTTGDLDANIGDNIADTSEATFTGTLGGAVGLDGAGANGFGFAANTTATIGLETVTYSMVGNVLTAKITTSPDSTRLNTDLFKVEITDPATGAYKVTLLDNVLHAGGPNNEATDAIASIAYAVTDADGSTAAGTLTVTFDDDAPTLSVGGNTTVVEGATATGTWSQTIGADQPGATTVVVVGATNYALGSAINTGNGTLTVNPGGTWSFVANNNLNNNLNPSISFTVKVTDADGDVAEDPHTVAITDGAIPTSTKNASITVNEEGLANANATGSVDNASEAGSDTVTFQAGSDNIVSVVFGGTSGITVEVNGVAPADIAWSAVGTSQLVGRIGGIVAITLDLVPPTLPILAGASGSATVNVTLSDNFPHPNANGENTISLTGVTVIATDTDGDPANATVSVTVIDDVPTARADEDSVDEDAVSATGNVISGIDTTNAPSSADTRGADGAVVTGIALGSVAGPVVGGVGIGLTGSYGSLNLAAGGGYTYTLDNSDPDVQALGVGDTATETFTYTITDGDGDTSTATLKITINGTNDAPTFDAVTVSVSEEGLPNANPDEDFAPDDTTNDPAAAGSINLTDIDLSDVLTVTLGTPSGALQADGVAIVWLASLDGKTLTGSAGGTPIISLEIDDLGNYRVDLLQPIDHLTANGENVATFTVPVSVFDGTTTVTNPTGITVRIEDDSPIAEADSNSVVEGAIITGSVLPNDEFGADGPTATTPAGGVVGFAAGNNVSIPATGAPGTTITTTLGALTLNADGSYSYDAKPNTTAAVITDTFVYTIRDADGDTSTTTLTITINPVTLIADNDTVIVNEAGLDQVNDAGPDTVPGTVDGSNPTSNSDVAGGTLTVAGAVSYSLTSNASGSFGTLALSSSGDYIYTLTKPFDTSPDINNGTNTESGKDIFTYTATDANGNTITGTITVDIIDDVPTATATANSGVLASLDETATSSTAATLAVANIGDDPDVTGGGRISFATTASAVVTAGGVFGADGAASVNPLVYALTVTNAVSGLLVTDGAAINLVQEGNLIVGRVATGTFAGKAAFAVSINATSGVVTVEQYLSLKHPNTANPDDTVQLAAGALGVTVTRTDGDGDKATSLAADISGQIRFDDDGPSSFTPQAATLTNVAGAPVAFQLDAGTGDNNIGNNYGADGPGTVRFKAALDGTDSGLKSGGQPIFYDIDNADPTILYGKVGATIIFTINLDPATSQYTVDLDGKVDSLINVQFTDAGYDFLGGNKAWFGIVPNGQDGTPVNDNSQDVLITPLGGSSVNTSGILGGIDSGQDVGVGEGFRIDYVVDLTGSPPNNYTQGVTNGHTFDSHWVGGTNGASISFRQSGGTELRFQAFDDNNAGSVVGDGTLDTINGIVITYNGVASTFLAPTASLQSIVLSGRTFTYRLDADGKSVLITNIGGASGNSGPPETTVAVFTSTGYNALEIEHVSGSSIKFAGFGAAVQSTNPVVFQLPVEIVDGDGDVVDGSNISITLNPAASPVALDLDGDGAEFLSMTAGVTFDYAGDGSSETTAWVGADDGLLAFDSNSDGQVNNGSEIVFGRDGLTDLQGLAADYDSNHDGQLTAADDNFALFGLWQDGNSNGVTDAGEFRSLSDAGIVSIGLVSDGIGYSAANGDVSVAGQSTYAKSDGTTGILADAAFATGAAQATTGRPSDQLRTSNVTSSIVAASLVGLAAEASPAFAHMGDMPGSELVQFEYRPFVSNFEPFDMATLQQDFVRASFAPAQEFVQHIGNISSSLRAVDEAEFGGGFNDAPAWQMSDLLGDSIAPAADHAFASMSAFGGDNMMHNILDMAAFGMPVGANDNPAIPMAAEDAIRGAMPDMMMDRLVDSFSADVGSSNDNALAQGDGGDALRGMLDQTIDTFHFSPTHSADLLGSQHYELNTSNN